jgi:hypothetical protein
VIDLENPVQHFIVAVILWWSFCCFLLPFLSGWYFLARRYRSDRQAPKKLWRFCNGSLRFLNHGSSLTLGADSQGFHIAMFPLFRIGHPPLFIPWHDVKAKSYRFLPMVKFRFAKIPSVNLILWKSTAAKLSAASEGNFAIV